MQTIPKDNRIAPFVKEIILLENNDPNLISKLPFYADGCPGILFAQTKSKVFLLPIQKELPDFFLYGQTIEPISLSIEGCYKLIVFQLYPFATRLLLDINPKEINDDCYDLMQLTFVQSNIVQEQLNNTSETTKQVDCITEFILALIKNASINADNAIKLAISTIINAKGKITIKQLRTQLHLSERTFERRFAKEIGVSPKQFTKIIQFNFSLNQLKESDYTTLTNIAYDNGFADQSHFIRTFKKYTGQTPKSFAI